MPISLLLIILLIVLLGAGGGVYGYSQWGAPGGALPLVVVIILVWLLFGR
jgi:hypothetical protein